eukprot:Gb_11437 [translate_table: standard]
MGSFKLIGRLLRRTLWLRRRTKNDDQECDVSDACTFELKEVVQASKGGPNRGIPTNAPANDKVTITVFDHMATPSLHDKSFNNGFKFGCEADVGKLSGLNDKSRSLLRILIRASSNDIDLSEGSRELLLPGDLPWRDSLSLNIPTSLVGSGNNFIKGDPPWLCNQLIFQVPIPVLEEQQGTSTFKSNALHYTMHGKFGVFNAERFIDDTNVFETFIATIRSDDREAPVRPINSAELIKKLLLPRGFCGPGWTKER